MGSGSIIITVFLISSAGLTAANVLRLHHRCVDPPNMAEMLANITSPTEYSLPESELSSVIASQSTECPTHTTQNGPISDRSTCPWYLQAQSDPTRYPNIVIKAELKCGRYCRKRIPHSRLVETDRTGTCQPINDTIQTLRYTGRCDPVTGFKQYVVVYETRPVGYTCVFRR